MLYSSSLGLSKLDFGALIFLFVNGVFYIKLKSKVQMWKKKIESIMQIGLFIQIFSLDLSDCEVNFDFSS